MEGLTGNIKFDSLGFRSDFILEVVELKKEGLFKVGSWSQADGINFTRNYTETYNEVVESLHNKTLKITTILVRTKKIILGTCIHRTGLLVEAQGFGSTNI